MTRRIARRAGALVAVACALAAAPALAGLTLAEAQRALADERLEDVYVELGGLKRGGHPAGDAAVARVLADTAKAALAKSDAALALALSDSARRLDPTSVAACLANADAAAALQQRAAAEEALDAALAAAPGDFDVVYRRAAFAEEEGELERAASWLRTIPTTHARGAEAKARAAAIAGELKARQEELARLRKLESEAARRQESASRSSGYTPPEAQEAVPRRGAGEDPFGYGELDGKAARQSEHFRILYSAGARDFAQAARYEDRVIAQLERAYEKVAGRLGQRPAKRVDVVLYTQQEFSERVGPALGGALLGFYSGRIRMNLSEAPNEQWFATAVHEYVHAAVDQLAQGRALDVPVWVNEGLARWVERRASGGDWIDYGEREELRAALRAGRMPSFGELARTPFGQMGGLVGVAYGKASSGVELLAGAPGGMSKLVRVLETVGAGETFEEAFGRAFGERRLERLDAEVEALVGR
jgi:hypothetical protein